MAFTTMTPGKFSAEAAVAGTTGSGVFVASGPASSLATHQFDGQVDANDDILVADGKSVVYEGVSKAATLTAGSTQNRARGFVYIITAGSAPLNNTLIKSQNTPIFLTPQVATGVTAAFAFVHRSGATTPTAGKCRIGLRTYDGVACTGRVFWHVMPES